MREEILPDINSAWVADLSTNSYVFRAGEADYDEVAIYCKFFCQRWLSPDEFLAIFALIGLLLHR